MQNLFQLHGYDGGYVMAPRLCNMSITLLPHIQAMMKNWRSQRGRKWLSGDRHITYESIGKFFNAIAHRHIHTVWTRSCTSHVEHIPVSRISKFDVRQESVIYLINIVFNMQTIVKMLADRIPIRTSISYMSVRGDVVCVCRYNWWINKIGRVSN
jgi:hypothetical protein